SNTGVYTLSLHDALPIWGRPISSMSLTSLNADVARELSAMIINAVMNSGSINSVGMSTGMIVDGEGGLSQFYPGQLVGISQQLRSEEHTSEFQSPCNLVC